MERRGCISIEQVMIIIPALNPLPSIITFVEKLRLTSISKIVIINDGSAMKYQPIFEELRTVTDCTVLQHGENKGKGRALKTGFAHILKHEKKIHTILTVGAHGQHTLEDIEQMLESAKVFSDGIVLGVRRFRSNEMPTFSFIGNRAATILFELLFRKRLLDIQSGLRLIPKQELLWLIKVPGEKFDYDLNMLIEAIRRDVPIYEIPIGYARMRKNSLMHYDEIVNMSKNLQSIWKSFLKNKK